MIAKKVHPVALKSFVQICREGVVVGVFVKDCCTHIAPLSAWHNVPGPLSGLRDASTVDLTPPPADSERERAALWIEQRLGRLDIPPEVRPTLLTIKADLEEKLGRHIRANS
jgi:hypothetical protein